MAVVSRLLSASPRARCIASPLVRSAAKAGATVVSVGPVANRRSLAARCAAAAGEGSARKPRQIWLPGSTAPSYLDGTLPGDNGFDPLGLAERPDALRWYVQAELVHCRWAMLGVAGVLLTDLLTVTGVRELPAWYEAGAAHYDIASTPTLFVVQMMLFVVPELKRWADFHAPGSQGQDEAFFLGVQPAFLGTDNGYPGGPLFNPLGLAADRVHGHTAREQELANGRLAMVTFLGFAVQAAATHQSPIQNLLQHLSDPWNHTVIQTLLD